MTNLNAFLHLYFYQIETILNTENTDITTVKFHSEEANTDEQLKLFFKLFLKQHNSISDEFSFDVQIFKDNVNTVFNISKLKDFIIADVLLPNDLSHKHKDIIQQHKKSIYTNPDLYIEIVNGSSVEYVSVELKSTKNNKIPGSSVQQVSPYEWVIFIQHRDTAIRIVTGMYLNSITDRLPFPDRSPRPEIGFNTLVNWNVNNRLIDNNVLRYNYSDATNSKEKILLDWHKFLSDEWLDTIKRTNRKKSEKWFNHTIRLYSLGLLKYYDSLSEERKHIFEHTICELINDFDKDNLDEI